ncbi:DoxX family protein [Labilithrix luteola]|uniref:DoxX family protein n=1 Tax=Labilithrix luteola TaxID=1391654 RepID=A0A0K1PZB5_9BACT|nr:DoxX family protein [Labilithrix luteola]AKU98716.1 DoxX family protein [Labilithrix luteola]
MNIGIDSLFSQKRQDDARDAGLLLLRIGAACLIWKFHMQPKLAHFDHELATFPDPIGVGHAGSFALALLSEGLFSIVVALGFMTRLAAFPILFTMAMVLFLAVRGFEGSDVQAALLYALPYGVIVLTGPGRWSLDHRLLPRYESVLRRLQKRTPARADA